MIYLLAWDGLSGKSHYFWEAQFKIMSAQYIWFGLLCTLCAIYLVWFAVYTVRGAGVCIYPRESSWEIYFNLVTIGLLKTGGEETLVWKISIL